MSDYSLEEALNAADNTIEESFVIDSDLRTIQGPQKYVLGVFNDQNVQTVHFKCPRYYNGIDLSTFSIKINYMNASKKYDMSLVKNIEIADDYITFDWLTSKNVFVSPGTVTFNVCLTKVDDNSNITNEFNTTIYSLDVLKGLEVTMSEAEESAVKDFLAYINKTKEHIDSVSESVTNDKASVSEMKDAVTNAKEHIDSVSGSVAEDKAAVSEMKDSVASLVEDAKVEAAKAKESETNAKLSETNASNSAKEAKASVDSVANVTSDVEKLKEDLSKKITKFYASNQGETHLADSDNGKIQDMMIYGKSLQDGTPTPENPVEIKSVANPTIKVCRKNLWDSFKTLSLGNVEQKNGTYIAKTTTMQVDITASSVGVRPLILKAKNTYTFSLKTTASISNNKFLCLVYNNGESSNFIFKNENFVSFIPKRDVKKVGFIMYDSIVGDKIYDVQLEMSSEATSYEPYHEQNVILPYTLNAIPVSSGGNVTINGQQYIADYIDVERGKVVRMCGMGTFNTKNGDIDEEYRLAIRFSNNASSGDKECIFSVFKWSSWETYVSGTMIYIKNIKKQNNELYTAQELKELSLDFEIVYQLAEKQETDLTTEQITALKKLATYYPVTNVTVDSEQLDGYTVFNYPISMANGWNYVKQQLNDNRDYIYDMDLQSAEAYVNSEYAVTLTELEV